MRQLKRWTQEEADRAARLRRNGVAVNDIAAELGRSRRSIKSILYQPRARPHRGGYFGPAYAGPPLAKCPEDVRRIKNAIEGSRKLCDAILRTALDVGREERRESR
jgi:IS30 family transposase